MKRKKIIIFVLIAACFITLIQVLLFEKPYKNIGKLIDKIENGSSFTYYNTEYDVTIYRDNDSNIYFSTSVYRLYIINDEITLFKRDKVVENKQTIDKYTAKYNDEYSYMLKYLNRKKSGIHFLNGIDKNESGYIHSKSKGLGKYLIWEIDFNSNTFDEYYASNPTIGERITHAIQPFFGIVGGAPPGTKRSTVFYLTTEYTINITLPAN